MPEPPEATAPGRAARDDGEAASRDDREGQRPPGDRANSPRKSQGDIHVGTMAGDVKRVPGSGTEDGDKAIADFVHDVLERVRRSIRERTRRSA